MGPSTTEISSIEHLILLDLLGSRQPSIRSFYADTAWLFDAMANVEQRLGDSGHFAYGKEQSMAPNKWRSYFRPRHGATVNLGYVGDDHLPFLKRGVSVLHIIAEPFPAVWHTLKVQYFFTPSLCTNRCVGRRIRTRSSDYAEMESYSTSLHVRIPEFTTRRSKVAVSSGLKYAEV